MRAILLTTVFLAWGSPSAAQEPATPLERWDRVVIDSVRYQRAAIEDVILDLNQRVEERLRSNLYPPARLDLTTKTAIVGMEDWNEDPILREEVRRFLESRSLVPGRELPPITR